MYLQGEKGFVQRTLLGMLMNPLSIDMQNFICAEELSTGALVGFGQVRRTSAVEDLVGMYVLL